MDQHTMKVSDLYDIAIFDISRDGEQCRKYLPGGIYIVLTF